MFSAYIMRTYFRNIFQDYIYIYITLLEKSYTCDNVITLGRDQTISSREYFDLLEILAGNS